MTRIAGVNLSREKRIVVVLICIHGIGEPTVEKIYADAGVSEDIRSKDLTPEDQERLRTEVDKYRIEDGLRCEISMSIKHLVDIGSYRDVRHHRGLPVHSRNTRNNARTHRSSRGSR